MLDSTVLIDALRGRPAAARVRRLRGEGTVLLTTAVNVEEIVRGLRDDEQPSAHALFSGLHVLVVGRREAELAGRWRREHAGKGVTLQQGDCLIGACAVRAGARLATGNPKDFPMAELDVESWPVGRDGALLQLAGSDQKGPDRTHPL